MTLNAIAHRFYRTSYHSDAEGQIKPSSERCTPLNQASALQPEQREAACFLAVWLQHTSEPADKLGTRDQKEVSLHLCRLRYVCGFQDSAAHAVNTG